MLSRVMESTRRNHALEHATAHLLTRRFRDLKLVGRTTPNGFYLYANVDAAAVEEAAREAVAALERDPELAVHPRCGTNLAVTAMVAGSAAFLAMGRGRGSRLSMLPQVLLASLWGTLLAQPIGHAVQRHLTTSPSAEGAVIGPVRSTTAGGMTAHFVPVSWR